MDISDFHVSKSSGHFSVLLLPDLPTAFDSSSVLPPYNISSSWLPGYFSNLLFTPETVPSSMGGSTSFSQSLNIGVPKRLLLSIYTQSL